MQEKQVSSNGNSPTAIIARFSEVLVGMDQAIPTSIYRACDSLVQKTIAEGGSPYRMELFAITEQLLDHLLHAANIIHLDYWRNLLIRDAEKTDLLLSDAFEREIRTASAVGADKISMGIKKRLLDVFIRTWSERNPDIFQPWSEFRSAHTPEMTEFCATFDAILLLSESVTAVQAPDAAVQLIRAGKATSRKEMSGFLDYVVRFRNIFAHPEKLKPLMSSSGVLTYMANKLLEAYSAMLKSSGVQCLLVNALTIPINSETFRETRAGTAYLLDPKRWMMTKAPFLEIDISRVQLPESEDVWILLQSDTNGGGWRAKSVGSHFPTPALRQSEVLEHWKGELSDAFIRLQHQENALQQHFLKSNPEFVISDSRKANDGPRLPLDESSLKGIVSTVWSTLGIARQKEIVVGCIQQLDEVFIGKQSVLTRLQLVSKYWDWFADEFLVIGVEAKVIRPMSTEIEPESGYLCLPDESDVTYKYLMTETLNQLITGKNRVAESELRLALASVSIHLGLASEILLKEWRVENSKSSESAQPSGRKARTTRGLVVGGVSYEIDVATVGTLVTSIKGKLANEVLFGDALRKGDSERLNVMRSRLAFSLSPNHLPGTDNNPVPMKYVQSFDVTTSAGKKTFYVDGSVPVGNIWNCIVQAMELNTDTIDELQPGQQESDVLVESGAQADDSPGRFMEVRFLVSGDEIVVRGRSTIQFLEELVETLVVHKLLFAVSSADDGGGVAREGLVPVPVKVGRKRYLWNTTPTHADESEFISAYACETKLDGCDIFVEANWSKPYLLGIVRKTLTLHGIKVIDA
jgi:hypothetical protein